MCLVSMTDTVWVLLISALLPQDPEVVLGGFHPLGSFQSQTFVSTGGCTLPRSTTNPHAQWSRDAHEADELEHGTTQPMRGMG